MAKAAFDGATDAARTRSAPAALKLEDFLPYRLNVLATLVSQALSRIYTGRYGIGISEWRVLVTLGQHGAMTGKTIGAQSQMHKTKVSRAVAQLEKRKLVAREINRDDMREAFLSLTPEGRAIYEEVTPLALDFARNLVGAVDAADRPAFDRAIAHLTEYSATLAGDLANAPDRR
jgi:DNA-binding MarR family transcriptional regulator